MNTFIYKILARKEHWIKVATITSLCLALIVPLLLYGVLPEQIPMQFAGNGDVTWTLAKPIAIFFPFLIILFLTLYFKARQNPSLGSAFLQLGLSIFLVCVFLYIALSSDNTV